MARSFDVWRRHAMLVTSLGLLGAGVFLGGDAETEFVRGICLKVGIVLFMIWLALPQLLVLNYWAVIPVAVAGLLAIIRPQLIVVAARVIIPLAPVLFLIWLLRVPGKKKRRT